MATEVMQITVPVEIAEQIRERVRSGEFATDSDVIIHQFCEHQPLDLLPEELDEAFRLGFEALDELHAHPESAVSMEQMRLDLMEQHRQYNQSL